jgi:hemoglobin-like flavoprotein
MELSNLQLELKSGIGINFGKAYIGHLGHPTHKQFSVIGDPVNVASRIQQETKKNKVKILISKSVYNSIPDDKLHIGKTFAPLLIGKDEETELFELLGFQEMDLQLELQASLHVMLEDQDRFAKIFYDKVFEINPEIRSLFRKNMTDQGRLLTHMLGGIVYSLSRPEHLATGLKKLGESHINYGVRVEHYPIVKEAMMYAIEQSIGERKTRKTIDAWSKALDDVMDMMKSHAAVI